MLADDVLDVVEPSSGVVLADDVLDAVEPSLGGLGGSQFW